MFSTRPGAPTSASSATPTTATGRPDARSRIGNRPLPEREGGDGCRQSDQLPARGKETRRCSSTREVRPINGQWSGSPSPVEHDIMTGSAADGTLLAGLTCGDWTSDSTTTLGQVGHSDGLGPNGNTLGACPRWNSAGAALGLVYFTFGVVVSGAEHSARVLTVRLAVVRAGAAHRVRCQRGQGQFVLHRRSDRRSHIDLNHVCRHRTRGRPGHKSAPQSLPAYLDHRDSGR